MDIYQLKEVLNKYVLTHEYEEIPIDDLDTYIEALKKLDEAMIATIAGDLYFTLKNFVKEQEPLQEKPMIKGCTLYYLPYIDEVIVKVKPDTKGIILRDCKADHTGLTQDQFLDKLGVNRSVLTIKNYCGVIKNKLFTAFNKIIENCKIND